AFAPAADEFHDTGAFKFWVLRSEFFFCLFIRYERGRIDVAAVDSILVIDSPAPAGGHCIGGCIGANRFSVAFPSADDGTIAKEAGLKTLEGLIEHFAK